VTPRGDYFDSTDASEISAPLISDALVVAREENEIERTERSEVVKWKKEDEQGNLEDEWEGKQNKGMAALKEEHKSVP